MSSDKCNTTPLDGTYLATPPHHCFGPPSVYYQNTAGLLCRLCHDGQAVIEEPQKPSKCGSALAVVDHFEFPIHPLPADRHVLGKNPKDDIIISVIPEHTAVVSILANQETKFATVQHDRTLSYVHYEHYIQYSLRPGIFGSKVGIKENEYLVSDGVEIAKSQPIAAISLVDGFRTKYSLDAAKAKYPAINIPEFGPTRYTVFHGDDKFLWLSETYEIDGEIYSWPWRIEGLVPQMLYYDEATNSRSPIALSTIPGRLVLYFLDERSRISRMFINPITGEPGAIITDTDLNQRRGTNLAVSRDHAVGVCENIIDVFYQDKQGNIKTFFDRIPIPRSQ